MRTIVGRAAAFGEANIFCFALETDRRAGLQLTESMCQFLTLGLQQRETHSDSAGVWAVRLSQSGRYVALLL